MQLIKLGIDATEARTKTNFLTALRQKPETPEQWAALTEACGHTLYAQDFQQIVELMWKLRESEK